MGILLVAWRILAPILTLGITLPVWAFLAAGAWWHFDKNSAIRRAVHDAVTELVAGEELEAERTRVRALTAIQAEQRRKIALLQAANQMFSERLAEAEREKQDMADEINELLDHPVAGDCAVDSDLLDRLRNR
jgi:hypothetical protein